MDWKRIQAAAIRFGWTFILAFLGQPIIMAILDGDWRVTWAQVGAAALAALGYAIKKYVFPDTTL